MLIIVDWNEHWTAWSEVINKGDDHCTTFHKWSWCWSIYQLRLCIFRDFQHYRVNEVLWRVRFAINCNLFAYKLIKLIWQSFPKRSTWTSGVGLPEIAVQVKMAESLTLTLVDVSISTEKVTLVVMRMNDYENDEKGDWCKNLVDVLSSNKYVNGGGLAWWKLAVRDAEVFIIVMWWCDSVMMVTIMIVW